MEDDREWKQRVEVKIDKLSEENGKQNVILGKMEVLFEKNTEILEEHQRRSLASEDRLDLLEQGFSETEKKIESHLSFVKGSIWVFGLITGLIGFLISIKNYFLDLLK